MSERIKPYGGSSRNRLTKLLNHTNSLELIESVDFEYSLPVVDIRAKTNTTVEVTAKKPGYRVERIHYNRLDIKALDRLPADELLSVWVNKWPFEIHSNLDAINEALGLGLVYDEVHNDIYYNNGQEKLTLRINENSFAWLEGEYEFTIRTNAVELATLWLNRILIGLNPPAKK